MVLEKAGQIPLENAGQIPPEKHSSLFCSSNCQGKKPQPIHEAVALVRRRIAFNTKHPREKSWSREKEIASSLVELLSGNVHKATRYLRVRCRFQVFHGTLCIKYIPYNLLCGRYLPLSDPAQRRW